LDCLKLDPLVQNAGEHANQEYAEAKADWSAGEVHAVRQLLNKMEEDAKVKKNVHVREVILNFLKSVIVCVFLKP